MSFRAVTRIAQLIMLVTLIASIVGAAIAWAIVNRELDRLERSSIGSTSWARTAIQLHEGRHIMHIPDWPDTPRSETIC